MTGTTSYGHSIQTSYDAAGQTVSVIETDPDGVSGTQYQYLYDQDGRMTRQNMAPIELGLTYLRTLPFSGTLPENGYDCVYYDYINDIHLSVDNDHIYRWTITLNVRSFRHLPHVGIALRRDHRQRQQRFLHERTNSRLDVWLNESGQWRIYVAISPEIAAYGRQLPAFRSAVGIPKYYPQSPGDQHLHLLRRRKPQNPRRQQRRTDFVFLLRQRLNELPNANRQRRPGQPSTPLFGTTTTAASI